MGCVGQSLEMPASAQEVRQGEILRALKQHVLFRDLAAGELADFMDAAKLRHVEKGKILYMHNEPAEYFYLVRSGWIKIFRETLDGEEAVVDVLTTGSLFGVASLFEDGAHGTSAQVVDDAQVLVLPTSLLKEKVASNHALAMNMITLLSHQRRTAIEEVEHLTTQSAPQRIGCFLLRLCHSQEEGEATLHLPYDKTLIASRLGMKPETFSRALARLKEEVGLEVKGSSVTIKDIEEVVHYTCSACSGMYPCKD